MPKVDYRKGYYRFIEEGAEVSVVGSGKKEYKSKHGYEVQATTKVSDVKPEEFDAVIIPGGTRCPDRLRRYNEVLKIVKNVNANGKVVAAICHGPWVLISAGIVKDREATSYFSIRDDMINAGAIYLDKPVVVDRNLVTSREPADLPYFCKAIIKLLQK